MSTETLDKPDMSGMRQKGRGRPARAATTPLGKFLQNQLELKGITLSGFARRLCVSRSTVNRLLYGEVAFISSPTADSICQALGLDDIERHELTGLIDALSDSAPLVARPSVYSHDDPEEGQGRGRPAKAPANTLGVFLQEQIKEKRATRSELARRLGVSASTIGRLLNGETSTVHSVSEENVSRALAMDDEERGMFHRLVHGGALDEKKTFAFVTTKGIDLDWADYYSQELQREFDQGNVQHVLEEARRYYNTHYPAKDVRSPEIQLRFGKLLALAQDVILPWNARIQPAIDTYNRIENMLFSFPLKKIPLYQAHYAYILARRAPLYREIDQFERSVQEFTVAIEQCISEVDNIDLHVELYYSRAHAWAVQGNVRNWLRDLDAARAVAQEAAGEHCKQLLGLVTYTQGEGYKRLAYSDRLDLSASQRTHYAIQGLECFEQTRFVAERRWAAHALIHGVAEAQCLARLEPGEAIRQCEVLRLQAQLAYPSIIQKIDRTIASARQRLNRRGGRHEL